MNEQTQLDLVSVCFIVGFVGYVIFMTTMIAKPRMAYQMVTPPIREWKPK